MEAVEVVKAVDGCHSSEVEGESGEAVHMKELVELVLWEDRTETKLQQGVVGSVLHVP